MLTIHTELKVKNRREEKKTERKKAAEHPVLFLQFPALSPLDRAENLTADSRRIDLHSGRLDQRLVVCKLAVLTENGAVSIVSLSPIILLYLVVIRE